jgi:hypothetical protein
MILETNKMKKKFTTTLDAKLVKELKIKAAQKDTTGAAIITHLLQFYFNDEFEEFNEKIEHKI